MALKAGYKGIKDNLLREIMDEFNKIDGIIPSSASVDNPLATQSEIDDIRFEQVVLGAKNMLENTANTVIAYGTVWTVNSDKTITAVSEPAEGNNTLAVNTFTFKAGVSYILSGTPDDGGVGTGVFVRANTSDYSTQFIAEPIGVNIKVDTDTTLRIECRVPAGDNTSHTFKPMIRLASDPDSAYVPYAMTNKELTNSVIDHKTAINAIIAAATNATDFTAFKTAMSAITPVTRKALELEPEIKITKRSAKKLQKITENDSSQLEKEE